MKEAHTQLLITVYVTIMIVMVTSFQRQRCCSEGKREKSSSVHQEAAERTLCGIFSTDWESFTVFFICIVRSYLILHHYIAIYFPFYPSSIYIIVNFVIFGFYPGEHNCDHCDDNIRDYDYFLSQASILVTIVMVYLVCHR